MPAAADTGPAPASRAPRISFRRRLTGSTRRSWRATPPGLDAYLDDDITIWIPPEPALSLGKAGLDAIRSQAAARLRREHRHLGRRRDLVVDSHQDVAWARHVLVVELAGGETEVMRCTSVWRRDGSRWLQVHSHEDLLPGVSYPFAAPAFAAPAGSASA